MPNVFYKDDPGYPSLLKKIGQEAPKQIYWKFLVGGQPPAGGCPQDIFNNCLAVIGSRKLTSYGRQAMEQLVSQIASFRPAGQAGITIVSGFMSGGDALAHETAIKVAGRTIAVMPCGIDRIHPQDQGELYADILNNEGLIISEYEGESQPALWTYPRRNRIVAGLSQALLIVEAGEKSGCLITANYARKFKRKIFVVPGPITSSVSKGSNTLIKEGAEMVTEAEDVLRWFKGADPEQRGCTQNPGDSPLAEGLPRFESKVLEMLAREPLTIDELSRELEMPSSELGVQLSMMEIRGTIKLRGNKYSDK